jgi:hypothetical protein
VQPNDHDKFCSAFLCAAHVILPAQAGDPDTTHGTASLVQDTVKAILPLQAYALLASEPDVEVCTSSLYDTCLHGVETDLSTELSDLGSKVLAVGP